MITPPAGFGGGYWSAGLYARPDEGRRGEYDLRFFEGADFTASDVPDGDSASDTASDAPGRGLDPRHFQQDDFIAADRFDTDPRRGLLVAAIDNTPGVETLVERSTDTDGDLDVRPPDRWSTTGPRQALDLQEGDLLSAVADGRVKTVRPEGVVFGWDVGRDYLFAPQGTGSAAMVYRWDADAETAVPKRGTDNEPVFTTYTIEVYRATPSDPIYGSTPDTDMGFRPYEPFFESDIPPGYDIDPFFQSGEEIEEIVGRDVFFRTSSGVVRQGTADRALPDAAGVRLVYKGDLTETYIIPASSNHDDRTVDIIAVEADNPFRAESTDPVPYARRELISKTEQTYSIGGRYEPDGQLGTPEIKSLVAALTPGDVVRVVDGPDRAPTGELAVVETGIVSSGTATAVPTNGSRRYVLSPDDEALGGGLGRAPLRLRLADGHESVGRVNELSVRGGSPPDTPNTTTSMEPEQGSMSSSPARRQVEQRYETIGTTEAAVMKNIRSLDLPTMLDGYDGIGPSTADALNDNGIQSPADLAVTVRGEQADAPAFGPLQQALEAIQERQGRAVLDAGRTLRDLALPETTGGGGAEPGMGAFPVEAVAMWDGEEIQFSFIDGDQMATGALDGGAVNSLRETLKLMYMDDADTGQPVADVTFTEPDEYSVDKRFDPIDLLDPEEFDTSGFSVSDGPPTRAPDVLVAAPDDTRIEIYDTSVYAYPSSTSPETKLVDETRATKMNVSPEQVLDRVEQKTGFRLVRDNRPERESAANAAGTAGIEDRTGSDEDESGASEAPTEEPTAQGLTEAEITDAMESVLKGTKAVVDIGESDVTVGWQATDDTPLDFNRGSAVLTGDTSVLEGLARQATKAYYDNVALSESTVDAIESAIESAPIDFPKPPTSAARPDESTGDGSDDDGITDKSGTNSVLSVDEKLDRIPDEEEQALREMMQRAEDFGLEEEERQFEAAAAIEPLVLERYGDIIQSLLPVDVQYASSSVAGYNIRFLPTSEGEDRIAGLGIMERPDLFVPAPKVPDLYDDLDTFISNIDTGRPGNEETKQTLERLDSLRALEIERGRVDISSLFLDREQIETFAAFHFGSMESNRGVWLGRMMNRIKELSKAMWAAQLMYQSERGDSEAKDFIDAKLSARDRIRRGSAVWYLDFADRIAAQGTFDAVDFVQRWYNAHNRFERRDFSPDDQPPKLEAYRDTPDSDTTTRTTDTSARDTTTTTTTSTDTSPTDQSPDPRPRDDTADTTPDPATTYEVFIVQRGGDRQVGIRAEGGDAIMTDSGGDLDRRQLLETLGRRTTPGAAAEDVFIGTVEAAGGDIRSSDLVRPLSGVPIEDMEGTHATAQEEPVSDTQVRGSTPEERGSTGTSRTASDETDIGTAEIDSFTAEEVSIDTLDVDIGGDVSLGVDDLDVETVESIEEDIEEDIGR